MERCNGPMERQLFGQDVQQSVLEIQYVVDGWLKSATCAECSDTQRRHDRSEATDEAHHGCPVPWPDRLSMLDQLNTGWCTPGVHTPELTGGNRR